MKIRPVGTELFHADGRADEQTDRHDEANSCFPQFCERAQKRIFLITKNLQRVGNLKNK